MLVMFLTIVNMTEFTVRCFCNFNAFLKKPAIAYSKDVGIRLTLIVCNSSFL